MTTFSRRVFSSTVATFKLPLGRPLGFPDCPFLNWECVGGLPGPTRSSEPDTLHLLLDVGKAPTRPFMNSSFASKGLPAAHDDVDVLRIDLHPIADPPYFFCRDYRGAASRKGIQDSVTTPRAIEHGVSHHRYRLHGGVEGKEVAFFIGMTKGNRRGILPHVGAITSKLTQL